MNILIPKGKYVLAVSGGVDSIVLLDILAKKPGLELFVAHFNHGIRPDSDEDEKLVRKAADKLKLPYETKKGRLGPKASEAKAREARYKFLEAVRKKHAAEAIITAHHQDDLVETVLLNIMRGTGWRGLSSITNNNQLKRPLLHYTKQQIKEYAADNHLEWREDSTNLDDKYLRNYLRLWVVPKLTVEDRQSLISNIDKVAGYKQELNKLTATISHNTMNNNLIDRYAFSRLPREVGDELVAYWLRQLGIHQFTKQNIQNLALAIKTSTAGSSLPVRNGHMLVISNTKASFGRQQ